MLPPKNCSVVIKEKAYKLNAIIGHATAILISFALRILLYKVFDFFISPVAPATIRIRPLAKGLRTD
jgi:hypothetical protein